MGSRDSLSSRTNLEIYLVDGGVGTAKIKQKFPQLLRGVPKGVFKLEHRTKPS